MESGLSVKANVSKNGYLMKNIGAGGKSSLAALRAAAVRCTQYAAGTEASVPFMGDLTKCA
jgi:hypothetical protein